MKEQSIPQVSPFLACTPVKPITMNSNITATSFIKPYNQSAERKTSKPEIVLNKMQADKLKQILSALPLLKFQ